MRLGGLDGQPQAQLDGLKSRALRSEAPAQRHLYTTEWRSLDMAEAQSGATLVISDVTLPAEYEGLSSRASLHDELAATLHKRFGPLAGHPSAPQGRALPLRPDMIWGPDLTSVRA